MLFRIWMRIESWEHACIAQRHESHITTAPLFFCRHGTGLGARRRRSVSRSTKRERWKKVSDRTCGRAQQARREEPHPRKPDPLARGPGNAVHGAQREGKQDPKTQPEQTRKKALESQGAVLFFFESSARKKETDPFPERI